MRFAFITSSLRRRHLDRRGARLPPAGAAGQRTARRRGADDVRRQFRDMEERVLGRRGPDSWSHGPAIRRQPVRTTRMRLRSLSNRLFTSPHSRADEIEWTRRLGPSAPGLIEHLTRHQRSYDVLVFFSVWHPTTVQGVQIAPDRSVLFPYLQLRPALRFHLWNELLESVRAVGYVSASERRLAHEYLRATSARRGTGRHRYRSAAAAGLPASSAGSCRYVRCRR